VLEGAETLGMIECLDDDPRQLLLPGRDN